MWPNSTAAPALSHTVGRAGRKSFWRRMLSGTGEWLCVRRRSSPPDFGQGSFLQPHYPFSLSRKTQFHPAQATSGTGSPVTAPPAAAACGRPDRVSEPQTRRLPSGLTSAHPPAGSPLTPRAGSSSYLPARHARRGAVGGKTSGAIAHPTGNHGIRGFRRGKQDKRFEGIDR